jgi:hypothetical protein
MKPRRFIHERPRRTTRAITAGVAFMMLASLATP